MLCAYYTIPELHEDYITYPNTYDINHKFDPKLKLPNYVYDKHVGSSPASQKTYGFFINNCVIKPRLPESDIERRAKETYISTNKGISNSIRPVIMSARIDTKDLKLIQTQLITNKHKPRTYYASFDSGVTYTGIIKGPYRSKQDINQLLIADRIKNDLTATSRKYESRAVTIGKETYYQQNCFIPIDSSCTTTASSRLESNVRIYNGPKYFYDHADILTISYGEQKALCALLAIRKIIGTNDTCCRNIIHIGGEFYSIDDPAMFKNTSGMFKTNVPKRYVEHYNAMVQRQWDYIIDTLVEWNRMIPKLTYLNGVQKQFMLDMIEELADDVNWKFD